MLKMLMTYAEHSALSIFYDNKAKKLRLVSECVNVLKMAILEAFIPINFSSSR